MGLRSQWRWSMETLAAAWRQGIHELGAALYGPGTAAQTPEYGMPWTKMPGEVMEDMKGKDKTEGKVQTTNEISLAERMREAAQLPDRGQELDRGMEHE